MDRIKFLSDIFSIGICSYAVMSNHYHIVVKVDSTNCWPDKQVLYHWASLHRLPILCDRFLKGESLAKAELLYVKDRITLYKQRLMDISWFMRELNQFIAEKANQEDHVKGHFWEARFKSQALLDERALLTCMAYVDLNPIRAAMAKTPEASDYTSIQERVLNKDSKLVSFGKDDNDIQYTLSDYLDLVDITGRVIREDKPGYIPEELPNILERLNLPPDSWLDEFKQFKSSDYTAIGTVDQIKRFCMSVGKYWALGLKLTPSLG
ncbi:alpha-amylase family glycosyl hydrolase [Marinicella sp. W31]|uniref:alpha-amylase family glycosyl hydrolase n=1 Tax=Marinicella sp. W31 TaxID=3023713 RepID=UPI003757E18D